MQNPLVKRRLFVSYIFLFTLLSVSFPGQHLAAQGDLLVAPKRIVFEGRERYKELTLSNTGKDTARYSISFLHYKMNEVGSLQELPAGDSSLLFADKYVRYFPRSVTLAPGESQVVRLQRTQNGQMETGEYRSHLYLRSATSQPASADVQGKATGAGAITIKLNTVFGIAVPVILHVGESTTTVALSHGSFQPSGKPYINITLNRDGNRSCYGDFTVDHIDLSGTATRVSELNGIAVYQPLRKREIKLALRTVPGVDYTKGKLHVVYASPGANNQNTIGQTEIFLD